MTMSVKHHNLRLNAFEQRSDDLGKGASRRLRRWELVPAIIYGGKAKPAVISVSHKELQKALENEAFYSHLITLKVDDGNGGGHPQGRCSATLAKPRIMHADFLRVSR
jgi:large subunit ribosomal protein L25